MPLFTLLTLLYIMRPRLIIHYLVTHYIDIPCQRKEENTMGKVCAFFGHRVIGADISSQLEQAVRIAITNGATTFWVGGYGAFDSYAAGCVRRLKKEYPQISLDLILAYLSIGKHALADAYDSTIYPEGLELVPQRFAISKRNRWIVDNYDMIIAYVRSTYGGAYTALRSAKRKGIHVVNLAE